MTGRSMVGVLRADGTFHARVVIEQPEPRYMVPTLAEIVHVSYFGVMGSATNMLLSRPWVLLNSRQPHTRDWLNGQPDAAFVGRPAGEEGDEDGELRGVLADDEWSEMYEVQLAYLFADDPERLTVWRLDGETWSPLAEYTIAEMGRWPVGRDTDDTLRLEPPF